MKYTEPYKPHLHYKGYYDSSRVGARARGWRLKEARKKGRHTKKEWEEMKDFFDNTCCCCMGDSGLFHVEKDHVIPIYQGGSDALYNLQPLCARCNSSKGSNVSDWRPQLADFLNKELPIKYQLPNG